MPEGKHDLIRLLDELRTVLNGGLTGEPLIAKFPSPSVNMVNKIPQSTESWSLRDDPRTPGVPRIFNEDFGCVRPKESCPVKVYAKNT